MRRTPTFPLEKGECTCLKVNDQENFANHLKSLIIIIIITLTNLPFTVYFFKEEVNVSFYKQTQTSTGNSGVCAPIDQGCDMSR